MRKKAAQRILEAIEARTRGAKIFSSGFSNWVSLKSRPTQFGSSKNNHRLAYWDLKEGVDPEPEAPNVPAPIA